MLKERFFPKVLLMVIAGAIALAPQASNAWNLICGVSIRKVDNPDAQQKWDADSYALKGISNYFYAVSELQRLELFDDGTVGVPRSLFRETSAIEEAIQALAASSQNFSRALEIANANELGDDTGLGLLAVMQEQTTAMAAQLQNGELPNLEEFHAITGAVVAFTQHGVTLSNEHLNMGLSGHGAGGDQFTNFIDLQ